MISVWAMSAIAVLFGGVVPSYMVMKGVERMMPPKEIPVTTMSFKEFTNQKS